MQVALGATAVDAAAAGLADRLARRSRRVDVHSHEADALATSLGEIARVERTVEARAVVAEPVQEVACVLVRQIEVALVVVVVDALALNVKGDAHRLSPNRKSTDSFGFTREEGAFSVPLSHVRKRWKWLSGGALNMTQKS